MTPQRTRATPLVVAGTRLASRCGMAGTIPACPAPVWRQTFKHTLLAHASYACGWVYR
jgi:hypothetical protein